MAPFAPSSVDFKSRKFSECSLRQIEKQLEEVRNGLTRNCFTEGSSSNVPRGSFDNAVDGEDKFDKSTRRPPRKFTFDTTTKKPGFFSIGNLIHLQNPIFFLCCPFSRYSTARGSFTGLVTLGPTNF